MFQRRYTTKIRSWTWPRSSLQETADLIGDMSEVLHQKGGQIPVCSPFSGALVYTHRHTHTHSCPVFTAPTHTRTPKRLPRRTNTSLHVYNYPHQHWCPCFCRRLWGFTPNNQLLPWKAATLLEIRSLRLVLDIWRRFWMSLWTTNWYFPSIFLVQQVRFLGLHIWRSVPEQVETTC